MQVPCRFEETLLTPGPTHVPERIFKAMSVPMLHHRTEVFKQHLKAAGAGIKWLTRSETDPIFIAGSGTAAMEAAILNLCEKGDEILVMVAGKFGERWLHIAAKLGVTAHAIIAETGESPDLDKAEEILKSKNIKAVCMQVCETSTTVQLPVKEICGRIKAVKPSVITIVDAVSAIATTAIHLDSQKIDILVSAAHKGLMLPPGLAIIILSENAWEIVSKRNVPSLYFDLNIERKALKKDTTAWTPAMNHIVALSEAINMIKEEGEENVYKRHADMATKTRQAFMDMGLKLMTEKFPSNAVTGVYVPQGMDAEKIRKTMYSEYKVRVAGGQEELQGKVIRLGHMGFCNLENVERGIEALRRSLQA